MTTTEAQQNAILESYGKLPITFVPNVGQSDSRVRYYGQAAKYGVYITPEEVVFSFIEKTSRKTMIPHDFGDVHETQTDQAYKGMCLALRFLGANPNPNIEGRSEGAGKVNYFKGNDPTKWYTNLPTYHEIVYREMWPGIDYIFHAANGKLKYEFVLQPGARVEDIQLTYRGSEGLSLDESGSLQIHTPYGILTDERPISYHERDGQQVSVTSSFVVKQDEQGEQRYGFKVGNDYDPRYALIIDPGLVYSTYLGGSGLDEGFGIAVDTAGSSYVTGRTDSPNFPTTVGAFQPTYGGGVSDAFVTKLNPAGSALVYSTYLGGSGEDLGFGIAVDTTGNAYVTGFTSSPNFPTTVGAIQPTLAGGIDAFVTKLNPAGMSLVYSTYLGGSGDDFGQGIAVDALANAYVTGRTNSPNFPTTAGAIQPAPASFIDAFVTKLNPTGTSLVYSTYLGGSGDDEGDSIAVDSAGNAYVTGFTRSLNFPTTAGAFQSAFAGGTLDAFVTKLNPAGTSLVYSTYLGGSGDDFGSGIAVDTAGNAYVMGSTSSLNFPTTAGAFQPAFAGATLDAYVTKLNPAGTGLVYSTYLGGSGGDAGTGIALDTAGNAYVTGRTDSPNFPTTADAFQPTFAGGTLDVFVTKLNPAGTSLVYSTYLGGSGFDVGQGISVDAFGNAYVTGFTDSPNFPTTAGAFQPAFAGGTFDAFVTKISTVLTPTPPIVGY